MEDVSFVRAGASLWLSRLLAYGLQICRIAMIWVTEKHGAGHISFGTRKGLRVLAIGLATLITVAGSQGASARTSRLSRVIASTLRQVKPHLAAADVAMLSSYLVPSSSAADGYPRSTAGRGPTTTVVIPGPYGERGVLAKLLSRGGNTYRVRYRDQTLRVEAHAIDRHHDFARWTTGVAFADIAVDLRTDATARRFIRDTVSQIDRGQSELKQITRAMSLIRARLQYDSDYRVVVPQGEGVPRPIGFYLQQGRGVCRQFAVALKLVSDELGIDCRLERGVLGETVLPLALRRKLKDQLDVRLCTRTMELGSLCAVPGDRGFHIYNEIRLKDGSSYTADATGKVLAPTTRVNASGLLRPIADLPWYEYVTRDTSERANTSR